jgi:hypothetical protein
VTANAEVRHQIMIDGDGASTELLMEALGDIPAHGKWVTVAHSQKHDRIAEQINRQSGLAPLPGGLYEARGVLMSSLFLDDDGVERQYRRVDARRVG